MLRFVLVYSIYHIYFELHTYIGGACGYADVMKEGYGEHNAALSTVMFHDGQTCGACYEIKCFNNSQWCKPEGAPVMVTATNFCPPNPSQPNDNGGWCNPPREHFDLSQPAFLLLAEYKAGITPVQYRRYVSRPCLSKINLTMGHWFSYMTMNTRAKYINPSY